MKYIIILLLPILIILGFNNKWLLSKYSNSNLAMVSAPDNYIEPERGIAKIGVTTKSPTATSTKIKLATPSYGSMYKSIWSHYVDRKVYINADQVYPYNTNVTYYFTDWDNMNKYGFFLGWINEATGGLFLKNSSSYSFTLLRNTEVISKYQNCAELSPKHVFFKSTDALERKLVKFANNIPDKNLDIIAKGEVSADAVVYGDGGVCAMFTEGCSGKVSCSLRDTYTFYNSYNGKDIKQIINYHTHDLNSMNDVINGKTEGVSDGHLKFIFDVKEIGLLQMPSITDYFQNMLKINQGYNTKNINIAGLTPDNIVGKVIFPNSTGYIYNLPLNKTQSSLDIFGGFKKYDNDTADLMKKTLNNILKKNNRTKPVSVDIKYVIDTVLMRYKKDFSAKSVYFEVN